MMLTLQAVALNDCPLSQPITAQFDAAGGTIGRADHNTMALPDPERHVSRLQAELVARGGGFFIRNIGGANPIAVAGRALARGEAAPLADGDEIRIAGYLLRVQYAAGEPDGAGSRGRSPREAGGLPAAAAAPRPGGETGHPSVPTAWPAQAAAPERPRQEPADPLAAAAGGALSSSNPFADLLGPPASAAAAATATADPFADLMPPPAGVAPSSCALPPSAAAAPAARLPDDFDPFATPVPRAAAAAVSPRGAAAGAFGDLVPGSPGPQSGSAFEGVVPASQAAGIDDLFGLDRDRGGRDPLTDFLVEPARPAPRPEAAGASPAARDRPAQAGPLPLDPLALFGGAATADADPGLPQADDLPAIHAAFSPPRREASPAAHANPGAPLGPTPCAVPAPAPAPSPERSAQVGSAEAPDTRPRVTRVDEPDRAQAAPPRAARPTIPAGVKPPTSAAADPPAAWPSDPAQAAWQALCRGAGIELSSPPSPQSFERVGQILRAAVEGTLQLVAVRASTKHELRAGVTMIQSRDNNPLKFAPDARAALEQLLQPPARGFLDGAAAMDDAMRDLVGHSIGTVAGMRAAIAGVLDRFAPEVLQAKLVAPTMFDSLLPMNRKARLWELYLQHYGSIREDAEDDFHTVFGKAFLAAYEQQVERLAREAGRR